MHFDLGYDKTFLPLDIPDRNIGTVLKPRAVPQAPAGEQEKEPDLVRRALQDPIGSPKLEDIIRRGEKIVIITSDITRPMPSRTVLPVLLDDLAAAGIRKVDISIVLALGNHRRHTTAEIRQLLGEEVAADYRCRDHDQEDVVRMGETSRGTPVDIFSEVAGADKRICLGNIEFHYFAGYSGGMKAVMPGVSSSAAVKANHRLMTDPGAGAGRIDGNPLREDIDEVYRFCPVHFIVNLVLDEKKCIAGVFAGDVFAAHRAGCAFLDTMYKCPIGRKADIVVVTPGGYPKDINLHQAQKAFENARHAVRDGGIVIFAAACREGIGDAVYERWIRSAQSPDQVISDINRKFELGGHKAAAVAMAAKSMDIFVVSELPPELLKKIFMVPWKNCKGAMEKALEVMGEHALVHVMPYGSSTLPVLA